MTGGLAPAFAAVLGIFLLGIALWFAGSCAIGET